MGRFSHKNKIYTKIVTCSVPISNVKNGILLHTLPKKDYEKEHIPDSFHLDAEMVRDMSKKKLHDFFMKLIEKNYPKIKKAIENQKVEWYAVPLILYCKNKNCGASKECLDQLYRKGMVKIKIFQGGLV